jgi:hypothetical protein
MKTRTLGIIFILVGLLIILHHVVISGRLFDIEDMLHHEFFEAILFTAGITILITAHSN